MVGIGLSFDKSGLELDLKIKQSAHLWSTVNVAGRVQPSVKEFCARIYR